MTSSLVASISEKRAMLKALGPRPGPEAVEIAQEELAKIEARLAEQLEGTYDAAPRDGVNVEEWRDSQETEIRESAEKEKIPYVSVIQLEELHQSFEDELEQEERVLDGRDYKSASVNTDDGSEAEVAGLLQDALENHRDTLDLSKRCMSHVPELFGRIITLVRLDLSNNQLQLLPDSVAGLVNLKSLKLNSNQLKSLPDSVGLLAKLKYLDVSRNRLRHLPETLGRCSSLVEINVNFNQLESIPSSFGLMLVNLQKFDLHLNKLISIPSSISDLESLKYLDLHMNKLRGLPSYIGNLSRLEYLDVSSNFNDLLSLPESMGSLASLTYCDLSFNQITKLPDSFGMLEQLKTLKLDGNPMSVPPMEVVEQSHDTVIEYMKERLKQRLEAEKQASEGGKPAPPISLTDYNGWVAWAGNSPVGTWFGSWWGSSEPSPAGKTRNRMGFQERQRDAFFEQQL